MQRVHFVAAVAIVVSSVCVGAEGSVLGPADGHSLFGFGNFSRTGGSTASRQSVGGNLDVNNSFSGGDLVVGGALTYANGSVSGNVTTGVLFTNPNNVFVSGTISQGSPIDFAAAETFLTTRSLHWGTLATTGTVDFMFGNLNLTGTDPTLNVFNVTETQWETAGSRGISAPSGSTVLVNIFGVDIVQSNGLFLTGGIGSANVLFNFPEATSLQNNIFTPGAILAPFANYTMNNGSTERVVIAASGTTSVFLGNNGDFAGVLPDPPDLTGDVPEPISAMVWGLGIIVATFQWRRFATG